MNPQTFSPAPDSPDNEAMPAHHFSAMPQPQTEHFPATAQPADEPITPHVGDIEPTPISSEWQAPSVAAIHDSSNALPPKSALSEPVAQGSDQPVAVVQALSVRGVEYTMMTLTLWFLAAGLIWSLLSVLNGGTSFSLLAFPIALMLVCAPVFALLFLHLRKAELANPSLRLDPSKRRLSQFTQVIAFATCLFNLIGFVYLILAKIGGDAAPSIGKSLLNLLVVLAIAGGILVYYWFDEHRLVGRR